ncbi:LysR family transcriptional regulator [Rhizobium sp. S163]|uniref:LysR family transcriptional regulator n=1 Tax=Rhizobium sp. S163 TaxID=3055039 RepID=UPI0025AA0241|nr:LysR family transcriptional regulator [Rhizobium sp. S163]MDM9644792.1 LysR family transcriptional regulator [Rhizobium sp. S163]
MNPRLLRTFLSVLHHRSFTRAAEKVHLAQSSVSDQIQSLESQLGVSLFVRSRTGLVPTPAASALRPYAEDMLRLDGEARIAVTNTVRPERQRLTIGALETIASSRLAAWLPGFGAEHPNVDVRLRVAGSGELLRRLGEGEIDVAVSFHDNVPADKFALRTLTPEPLALICRRGVRKSEGKFSPAFLAAQEFVVTGTGCIYRRIFDEFLSKCGVPSPKLAAEVESIGAIINFVSRSSCLGLVPRLAVESALEGGKIEAIEWGDLDLAVPLSVIWRRRRVQTPAVKAFLEDVKANCSSLRPADDRPRHEAPSPS